MSSVLYDAPGPRARRRELLLSTAVAGVVLLAVLFVMYRQLDSREQWAAERWQVFSDPPLGQRAEDVWRSLLVTGLLATLKAAAVAAVIAAVLGVVLAIGRMATVSWIRIPGDRNHRILPGTAGRPADVLRCHRVGPAAVLGCRVRPGSLQRSDRGRDPPRGNRLAAQGADRSGLRHRPDQDPDPLHHSAARRPCAECCRRW